ncbi:MAG: terminase family protein [Lachnospiraceae bacterium]|nr:terminase family protein [Lachnospiraceae bacterium]
MEKIVYNSEPTLSMFHRCDSFVRGVMGPVGSGKSVACCMEILQRACRQSPNKDGIRKSRWAIIRNTYGELKTTTIKTWQDWVPDIICPIVYDTPIRGKTDIKQKDGTRVQLEVLFIALDRPQHARKLLSLEITGAWINEAREIPKAVLDVLSTRLNRYPKLSDGGASWSGIIMDTNPPDEDHWWYRFAEEETPENWKFFQQPPALLVHPDSGYIPNPNAENISHHKKRYGYYLDMIPGKTAEWIKVYVLGQYGSVMDGKPVYPEYNDSFHCAKTELAPIVNLPLIIGFDFGLTPSCVVCQITARGVLRVLDEIISENMGVKQFMRDLFMPFITTRYKEFYESGNICIVGDPAGNQRTQADDSITCFTEIQRFGFYCESADSNAFITRRESVAAFMTRMDGTPSFQLSSRCKWLRKGFLGGYKYTRVQVIGDERFKDMPDKNMYSHIQDALQYVAMRASRGNIITNKRDSNSENIESRSAWSM